MKNHEVTDQEFKQQLKVFNAEHLKLFKVKQREMLMTNKINEAELELATSFTKRELLIVTWWLLEERRMLADAGCGDETVNTLLNLAQRLKGLAK